MPLRSLAGILRAVDARVCAQAAAGVCAAADKQNEVPVAVLALSRNLTFHARGDAAFVWHGLTGDVAEMSRDVLALLFAFEPAADEAVVLKAPPAGLTKDQVEEFVPVLRSRRFLVSTGIAGRIADELAPLLPGHPRVPRATVYERVPQLEGPPRITLYTRSTALPLEPRIAAMFDRCDGERTLGQVLADAGPAALPELLRFARADVAALKILPKPASQGGVQLNPAAESTMPYPELPDARAYAVGAAAPERAQEENATIAQLFRDPHPSLKGRSYGAALGAGLLLRSALEDVQGRPARVLELGSSKLGDELREGLKAKSPDLQLVSEARAIPEGAEAFDLIVASEMAGRLGTAPDESGKIVNQGALGLLREAARALAPGGHLCLIDLGDPKADPARSEGDDWSLRFADLQSLCTELGLKAKVMPLAELLLLDGAPQALSTTRASFPALRSLFAAHGLDLTRRAWLRTEIEKLCEGKLDLTTVHGLQWAPLAERALGLSLKQFWVLLAQKPVRVLH